MIRERIAVCMLALEVCACQPPQQETQTAESLEDDSVTAPSGQKGFVVECVKPADCVKQAGERCPSGYQIQPLGASGETSTTSSEHGAAILVDGPAGPTAVGASKGESKSETKRQFMVECKGESATAGAIGAPCETEDNCARLRVGLREGGLAEFLTCAPGLAGKKVCTFQCAAEDAEKATRLEMLCDELHRKCIATGADAAATTCQNE